MRLNLKLFFTGVLIVLFAQNFWAGTLATYQLEKGIDPAILFHPLTGRTSLYYSDPGSGKIVRLLLADGKIKPIEVASNPLDIMDIFIYTNHSGMYLDINGTVYGPYDSAMKPMHSKDRLGFYFEYTLNGKEYMNVSGKSYGPYDRVDQCEFAGGSRFLLQYNQDGGVYFLINGKEYGPYDSGYGYTSSNGGNWCYKYRKGAGVYACVNGKIFGPYKDVYEPKFNLNDTFSVVKCKGLDGKDVYIVNGVEKIMPSTESAHDFRFASFSPRYMVSYIKNQGGDYLHHVRMDDGSDFGPFKFTFHPLFTADGRHYSLIYQIYSNETKRTYEYALLDGVQYGPAVFDPANMQSTVIGNGVHIPDTGKNHYLTGLFSNYIMHLGSKTVRLSNDYYYLSVANDGSNYAYVFKVKTRKDNKVLSYVQWGDKVLGPFQGVDMVRFSPSGSRLMVKASTMDYEQVALIDGTVCPGGLPWSDAVYSGDESRYAWKAAGVDSDTVMIVCDGLVYGPLPAKVSFGFDRNNRLIASFYDRASGSVRVVEIEKNDSAWLSRERPQLALKGNVIKNKAGRYILQAEIQNKGNATARDLDFRAERTAGPVGISFVQPQSFSLKPGEKRVVSVNLDVRTDWGVALTEYEFWFQNADGSLVSPRELFELGAGDYNPVLGLSTNGFGSILWRFSMAPARLGTSYNIMRGPFYYADRIYVTSDFESKLYCLNPLSGQKLWEYSYHVSAQQNYKDNNKQWDDRVNSDDKSPIKRASPLVFKDNSLYFAGASYTTFWGSVFKVNALSGKSVWRHPVYHSVFDLHAVRDGQVYFEDGCLDDADGRTVWDRGIVRKRPDESVNWLLIDGDQILFKEIGTSPPLVIYHKTVKSNPVISRPCGHIDRVFKSVDNGRIFLEGRDKEGRNLYCVNAQNGEISWKFNLSSDHLSVLTSEPLLCGGRIVFAGYVPGSAPEEHRYFLYALNVRDGRLLWKTSINNNPIPYNELPIVCDNDNLYFTEYPFNLSCHSSKDGKRLWTLEYEPPAVNNSVEYLAPYIRDGRAYVSLYYNSISSRRIIRKEVICIDIRK